MEKDVYTVIFIQLQKEQNNNILTNLINEHSKVCGKKSTGLYRWCC